VSVTATAAGRYTQLAAAIGGANATHFTRVHCDPKKNAAAIISLATTVGCVVQW